MTSASFFLNASSTSAMYLSVKMCIRDRGFRGRAHDNERTRGRGRENERTSRTRRRAIEPPEPHWRARAAKNARISQVRELCAPPSSRNDRFGRSRAFPLKKTPGQKFSLTYFGHAVRFRSAHNSWTWCFSSDFDDGSARKSRTCAPTATPNGSRALRTLARAARSNRRNPHPR